MRIPDSEGWIGHSSPSRSSVAASAGLGGLVRQGQEEGTIRSMGETAYRQPVGRDQQVDSAEAVGVKQ